jgi:hypothetical protein
VFDGAPASAVEHYRALSASGLQLPAVDASHREHR